MPLNEARTRAAWAYPPQVRGPQVMERRLTSASGLELHGGRVAGEDPQQRFLVAPFLDDQVAGMPFDHGLDVGLLVSGDD